jgi:hypothetical protein
VVVKEGCDGQKTHERLPGGFRWKSKAGHIQGVSSQDGSLGRPPTLIGRQTLRFTAVSRLGQGCAFRLPLLGFPTIDAPSVTRPNREQRRVRRVRLAESEKSVVI